MAANRPGFTLIELSIVLVIIGLIVGGVLAGRDLIRAAEMRAQITQIEKYNAAVNVFRGKYNAVPGDIPPTQATALGFFAFTTSPGTRGLGDNNELIENTYYPSPIEDTGENMAFWRHLSDTGLIDGRYNSSLAGDGSLAADVSNIATLLPPSKVSDTNFVMAYALSGVNYFHIYNIDNAVASGGNFNCPGINALTPIMTYIIDKKIDDGMPNTGKLTAWSTDCSSDPPTYNPVTVDGICVLGADGVNPTDTYNLDPTNGASPGCSLRLRFN